MSQFRTLALPRTTIVVACSAALGVGVWAASSLGTDAPVAAGVEATADPSAAAEPSEQEGNGFVEATTPPRDPDAVAPPAPPEAAAEILQGPDGRPLLAPAPIDATVEPAAGVKVRVAKVESVTGEAVLPGEVGGPAARVHVEVANSTDAPLDLTYAVLNAYTGADLTPAGELSQGGTPFPPSVDPGETATAAYVVRIGPSQRDLVRLEVDLGGAAAVALFEGALPN